MLSDDDFRKVLSFCNRPWKGYRKVRKGVMRRIRQRMRRIGCTTVHDYLTILGRSGYERDNLNAFLLISISRFNRDRWLWSFLDETIIPELVEQTDSIKAWSAGCSCGEEPYSLLLLWQHRIENTTQLQITATDVNRICLERAKRGVYPPSSLRELTDDQRESCFSYTGEAFKILARFKHNIRWLYHDFMKSPPPARYDIVLLRNSLLTYHNNPRREQAFGTICLSLRNNGYLITGSHETIPPSYTPYFVNLKPGVYRLLKELC